MMKRDKLKYGAYSFLVGAFALSAVGIAAYRWQLQASSLPVSLTATTTTELSAAIDPLPAVDFPKLKQGILSILGSKVGKYGIYTYDLRRRQGFAINGGTIFPPASLSKVPVAILLLRDIQSGKFKFDDVYPIKNSNKPYTHDRMAQYPEGKLVNLNKYLYYSIVYSDNTANATLEDILGGSASVNQRIVNELDADTFFRLPHQARANSVGKVFRNLYDGIYLQGVYRERLMYLLLNTASHLQDGIPARLPAEARVAHKTGQLPFYVWEDAGIVYGANTEFVLAIVNTGVTYSGARDKTQRIAKLVYDTLN
jgi:beta-lactamase class A